MILSLAPIIVSINVLPDMNLNTFDNFFCDIVAPHFANHTHFYFSIYMNGKILSKMAETFMSMEVATYDAVRVLM